MLTVEDRFKIQDVISRLNNSCDLFRLEEAATALTEDVEISMQMHGVEAPLYVSGREAFVSSLAARHQFHQEQGVKVRHFLHNLQLLEGREGVARFYAQVMVVYHRPKDETQPLPIPVQCSDYEYLLRKIHGQWLISEWSINAAGQSDAAALYNIQL